MTSGLLAISLQASMHDHPDMRFIEKVIPLYTGQSEIFHILAYRDSSGSNDYANGGMLGGFHITRTSVKDPILMKAGMRKKYARRPESVKGSSTRTEKPQTLNPPDGTDTKKNPKRLQPFRVLFVLKIKYSGSFHHVQSKSLQYRRGARRYRASSRV